MENVQACLRDVSEALLPLPHDRIADVIAVLEQARAEGWRIFIFGNGGSAATASHFGCDLGKGTVQKGKPRFKVIALNDKHAYLLGLRQRFRLQYVIIQNRTIQ